MSAPLHAVILAAGEGTRLGGAVPKVVTPLWGRPSVAYPLLAARSLDPAKTVVVAGKRRTFLDEALAPYGVSNEDIVQQDPPRGTGDAVLQARRALGDAEGHLLVLYGDCPLVRPELLEALVAEHRRSACAITLLTVSLPDPTGYGRVVRDDGLVARIVEEADADDETRAIDEVNTGVWVVDCPWAFEQLAGLGTDNAQGEVYLTDLVARARDAGLTVGALRWHDPTDVVGFNTQAELGVVRRVLRQRILDGHARAGVEIVDPDTTFIDAEVEIEPGARILPCTMIEGRTTIAAGCEVGPFSHVRTGTVMEPGSAIGNFVETKKAHLGPGAKAKHLTYLGDAEIGEKANIGCGTITANYDGVNKHRTTIGAEVFIGSGTVIVAPAEIEQGAKTGAGAIVTGNSHVGPGEVWVGVPARPLRRTEPST